MSQYLKNWYNKKISIESEISENIQDKKDELLKNYHDWEWLDGDDKR